ncbi:hypothetical protein HPB48_007603 [Haemaphysalis longicornis]|uniref:Uncharacterized protein n=1 Tax=Haemaphysalis longicornis TaxID=44386 RepID=A0A9J6FSU9_HAELO|nr:hypothetical protein HPB48_007603 [Haemaphysalis longicornis]
MDLMLSMIDEGYHLGSAVAALVVIAHAVYAGLESVDEVTSLVQKCLLLHFHVMRLRPGSGVLVEVAVWLLDMALHLWFLLVDCTRVVSSLYFHNRPLNTLHCAVLFIFHLQILRRYCTAIHVTVDNEEPVGAEGPGSVGHPVDVDESSMLPMSLSSATKLTSQSTRVVYSRDELSLDLMRMESECSSGTCRCCRPLEDRTSSHLERVGREGSYWLSERSAPGDSDGSVKPHELETTRVRRRSFLGHATAS